MLELFVNAAAEEQVSLFAFPGSQLCVFYAAVEKRALAKTL